MKIEKFVFSNNLEQIQNYPELISNISDRILGICVEDKSFNIGKKIKSLEERRQKIVERLSKKESLLEESKGIEDTLKKKLETLENENFQNRLRILELLGSEL